MENEKKRLSNKKKRKELHKALKEKRGSEPDPAYVEDQMLFYENGYDKRWFYEDWVKAGRPKL